jgi:hypothetical protein
MLELAVHVRDINPDLVVLCDRSSVLARTFGIPASIHLDCSLEIPVLVLRGPS